MPALQAKDPGRLELSLAAAAAGLAAQTVQVVCLREIFQVARGGEAVLGIALAAWLVGSGLGAATWRGGLRRAAVLVAVLSPAVVLVLRALPPGYGGWAPGAALLAAVGAYAPGALFAAVLSGLPAARALAREAIGACVAGLLLTFLLLEIVPALGLLLATGAICLAVCRPRWLALVPLALLPMGAHLEYSGLRGAAERLWPGSRAIEVVESPYGRLHWLERGPQKSLYVNGQLALTVPDEVGPEAFVSVVLASQGDPGHVLVVGLGGATILEECLRHPVRKLEWAVQDRATVDLLRALVPPGVAVLEGDPRLAASASERDLVLVVAGEPTSLATNRFYTRDFFSSVNAQWIDFALPAAPNEREGDLMARNVAVFRTLAPREVTVLPGPADLFLAGRFGRPAVRPEQIGQTLHDRGIRLRHHAQDFFAEDYRPDEVARVTRMYRDYPRPAPPAVPFAVEVELPEELPPEPLPNTDLHPGAVLHSAAALAQEEDVPALRIATRLAPWSPWLLLVPSALGLLLAWRRDTRAVARLTAFTTGAASMGVWIVLLMVYQSRVGALYGDLALLAAMFMAGFAAGARSGARLLPGEVLFVLACVLVPLWLPVAGRSGLVALTALIGVAGGATLASAASSAPESAPRLYAWDLAGAACAALLYGTFLVPALGATTACATAAGLKLLSSCGALRRTG